MDNELRVRHAGRGPVGLGAATRRGQPWLAAGCLVLLAACGERGAAERPAAAQASPVVALSAVVTSTRPDVTSSGMAGLMSYDAVSTQGTVTLRPLSGAPVQMVTTAGNGVIFAASRRVGPTLRLFLGVNDAQDNFYLQSVADADGDGLLEPATLATHVTTSPTPAYFMSMAVVGNDWYFLDRRTQDIRLARDSNSDGLPDQLVAAPYAMSQTWSYLLSVESIGAREQGRVLASHADLAYVPGHEAGWAEYVDANLDGVAETEVLEAARTEAPVVLGHPSVGQDKVYLHPGHANGKTAEVWTLDVDGDDDDLLGSALLASSAWTAVTLSPPLGADDRIAVRFQGESAAQLRLGVGPAGPQIYSTTPPMITRGVTSSLALVGQGFASGMTAHIRSVTGTVYVIPATVTDSEHAAVTLPTFVAADDGLGSLWAQASGAGVPHWSRSIPIVAGP